MRKKIVDYDKANQVSYQQKAETLVVEWSGANDLVTVNAEPSREEVDKAIAARVDNVKKLIAAGYRNFVLFELPNLSLTPRFQAKTRQEREEAEQCTLYFNTKLQQVCAQLHSDYPHCSIGVFNVNTMFEKVYRNPGQFLFDQDKLTVGYTQSPDFDNPADGISAKRLYVL